MKMVATILSILFGLIFACYSEIDLPINIQPTKIQSSDYFSTNSDIYFAGEQQHCFTIPPTSAANSLRCHTYTTNNYQLQKISNKRFTASVAIIKSNTKYHWFQSAEQQQNNRFITTSLPHYIYTICVLLI